MPRTALALIAIATLTSCATSAQQAPLLTDTSFEEAGDAWRVRGEAEILTDPAIAHSGERCAKTRFEDGISQRVAIDGGSAYRISGWIKRVDPEGAETPKIKVYFYDADGNEVDVQATEFPDASGAWSQWEAIVQAPFNATELNLTLRGFYTGSEWFYWDDLAMQQVDAPDWPRREDTPNLDGLTVTIPDIADVWTDALLRWPPTAIVPFDGRLDTSVLLRGENLRVELQRPIEANWALIHTMRPGMNLGNAMLMGRGPNDRILSDKLWWMLGGSQPGEELVTSVQSKSHELNELLLRPLDDAEVHLNEIQLFGLHESTELPGNAVSLHLSDDAPEAMTEDVAAAFAAEEHRAALTAVDAGDGEYALPTGRYTSIFASPVADEFGLSGVALDLSLPGASEGDMIEICLKRPEELDINIRWTTTTDRGLEPRESRRMYSDLCRVVSRVEGGRLQTTLDVPDLLYAEGEPIWLTLRARRDMTLDLAQSRIIPHTIATDAALAEYIPQLERIVRWMYADATEAHVYDRGGWDEMVMGRYVQRLLALDPGNVPGTHIHHRIARIKPEVTVERPGPADAPDWAVWAREAMRRRHEILSWWLDNRQQANGELGGHINDDGEYSCNWPSMYLMTGDERIADALRKLSDVAWEMSAGTGYT
ncbi:MAG: hypothetical protein GF393_11395, partial [Armatimonadia bacterium]|nr:hypothetical protein [Armatimonadia bacterium]